MPPPSATSLIIGACVLQWQCVAVAAVQRFGLLLVWIIGLLAGGIVIGEDASNGRITRDK